MSFSASLPAIFLPYLELKGMSIKQLDTSLLTPFPASTKVWIDTGTVKVAQREITLTPTLMADGSQQHNPPLPVYDTSGPYTDDNSEIDITQGLLPFRKEWIAARNDTEQLEAFSSSYTRIQQQNLDRKSTRLNSSHVRISYAVFCLKKKT